MEAKLQKKRYQKPQVRRVELSLAEVTLATGCFGNNVNNRNPDCPAADLCRPA
jgi:hypothetical protein